MAKQTQSLAIKERNVSDQVLKRVHELESVNQLRIPKDYSAENALRGAWLVLQDQKTKDDKPVLEACSDNSIANSLFKMVVTGLSPIKKQCYFIPYGNKLTFQEDYTGKVALAKRFGGLKHISANVIYEKDTFKYTIDPATGRKKVVEHTQELGNIDINKIRGAYATLVMNDDTIETEIMSIQQIRQAWLMGQMNGNSKAHKNFTDRMARKTVIARACDALIRSSDDKPLFYNEDEERTPIHQEPEEKNPAQEKKRITFDDAEDVDPVSERQTTEPGPEPGPEQEEVAQPDSEPETPQPEF
jgi:recombination protein RecT